jgi:YmgG-like glycine-zipper protein
MRKKALIRYLMIASVLTLFGCRNSATPPDANTPTSGNAAPGADTNSNSAQNSAAQKAPDSALAHPFTPKPIVVAAGTELVVTADQTVSSKDNNSGDHFDASLAEPVIVGDRVVIPKGARATGTVTDAKSAGRFKGNAAISLTLSSLKVSGEEYKLQTTEVTEASKGRGKRTAEGAGGGAVVGALIGALAGGGKGAAIGAGAGAGAGTAGTAMTGKRDITIGAETKLRFKLKDPLEIKKK